MNKLNFETKIKPADQFLQEYQVDWEFIFKFILYLVVTETFQSGKADDFEVLCRDGKFGVHFYCLVNSDFLYKHHKARKNFESEGKVFD